MKKMISTLCFALILCCIFSSYTVSEARYDYYDDKYDEGYQEGYDEGYDSGWGDGKEENYNEAFCEGYYEAIPDVLNAAIGCKAKYGVILSGDDYIRIEKALLDYWDYKKEQNQVLWRSFFEKRYPNWRSFLQDFKKIYEESSKSYRDEYIQQCISDGKFTKREYEMYSEINSYAEY